MKLENSKNSHLGRMMGSLSLGVMIFAVALAVLMNIQTTRKRVSEQTAQYIKISTMQNEQIIDRLLVDAKESIKSIGKLFGQIIDENGNVTAHDIESLNQNVSFESLIYVNKHGIGIDQNNIEYAFADATAYYDALKGDTVIALNPLGNSDMQNRICFFAPVEKDGEIAGVLVGNFDDATLKKFMNTKLFGYTSTAFICSESGEIVANSVGILQRTTLTSYLKEHNLMDDNGIAELRNSLKNKNQYAFEIHGKNYESSAYMMRLENSGLILVQAFPVEATNKLNATANKDSWRLVTILAVFFIIYLIGTVVFNVKKQRNIMNEKESVENIVTAITQMFDRFILVDLDEDKYEYIIEDENKKLPGIGFEGSYGDILQNIFSKCFKNDEKHTSVDTMLQREKLIEQLDFGKDTFSLEYSEEFDTDNEFRWTNLAVLCVERRRGVPTKVLMASQDETELKKKEVRDQEALREAYQAAENASNAKSDFLSKMSHDIRTPMNAIIGMTALAGSYIDDKDRMLECLKKITSSSKLLLGLINEVLDMSRIESGNIKLVDEDIELSVLLEDVLELVKGDVKNKNLDLNVSIENMKHEKVIGDSIRIQKIFTNIISNSIKYTPNGGKISITVNEKPTHSKSTSCFEFIFEDTGIGMSKEFVKKIFVPFERAEDSRIDKIQGTGLGMAIVNNIIHMMGGEIQVESEINKGSRFTVTMVLKLQDDKEETDKELINLKVLVVDDEKVVCDSTCKVLNSIGMNSEGVTTGKEAVTRVVEEHEKNDDFYAAIIDWNMPEMNGIETTKEIRKAVGKDVPIIIMSAYDWSDIEEEAKAAGVNAFISKPLFKSRLTTTFKQLLNNNQEEENPLSVLKNEDYSNRRALVVEDNELNAEIMREMLNMTGIKVDRAENGKVAVEKLESEPENYYDIVFMDIQMPIMNGYQAAEAIRQMDQRKDVHTIPIIAVTANAFVEDILTAKAAGMNEHIAKPVDIKELDEILQKWL